MLGRNRFGIVCVMICILCAAGCGDDEDDNGDDGVDLASVQGQIGVDRNHSDVVHRGDFHVVGVTDLCQLRQGAYKRICFLWSVLRRIRTQRYWCYLSSIIDDNSLLRTLRRISTV